LIGVSVLGVAGLQEQISRLFLLLPAIFIAILILFVGLVTLISIARGTSRRGECRLRLSEVAELVHPIRHLGFGRFHGAWNRSAVARQTVLAAFSIVFGALMLDWRFALVWAAGNWLATFWSEPKRQEKAEIRGTPATVNCFGAVPQLPFYLSGPRFLTIRWRL